MSITWYKKQKQNKLRLENEEPHKLYGFDNIKPLKIPLAELKKKKRR